MSNPHVRIATPARRRPLLRLRLPRNTFEATLDRMEPAQAIEQLLFETPDARFVCYSPLATVSTERVCTFQGLKRSNKLSSNESLRNFPGAVLLHRENGIRKAIVRR